MKGYTELKEWRETLGTLPRHGAILHLFVAVDAEKVVNGKKLADHASWRAAEDEISKNPAHLIVQDWGRSMQDSQNLCSFFIPSLLDRSVCPEGKHVIHVYSSGGEPYETWESLEPGSAEYEAYKEERGDILWKALENCIPDAASGPSSTSSGRRWPMRRSCGGTGARTAWRGRPGRARRTRGC